MGAVGDILPGDILTAGEGISVASRNHITTSRDMTQLPSLDMTAVIDVTAVTAVTVPSGGSDLSRGNGRVTRIPRRHCRQRPLQDVCTPPNTRTRSVASVELRASSRPPQTCPRVIREGIRTTEHATSCPVRATVFLREKHRSEARWANGRDSGVAGAARSASPGAPITSGAFGRPRPFQKLRPLASAATTAIFPDPNFQKGEATWAA